jgi:preprotein translocase subunit Sec63
MSLLRSPRGGRGRRTQLLLAVLVLLLLVAAPLLQAAAERDFYKILGLSNDATEVQIKKAFRKLSLK